jgi:hypothetical protein
MPKDSDIIKFSALNRGNFVSRLSTPAAGFAWIDKALVRPVEKEFKEVPGPWLIDATPEGEPRVGYYRPGLYRADLHRSFAKLATQRQILVFANSYGQLGEKKESLWHSSPNRPGEWTGSNYFIEHLNTWLHEIRRMAALIALWDLVEVGNANELRHYITWGTEPRRARLSYGWAIPGRGRLLPIEGQTLTLSKEGFRDEKGQTLTFSETNIAIAEMDRASDEALAHWKDGEVIAPTRHYVVGEVNKRLRGRVNPTILAFGENRLYFQPDSLLAALYTLLALEISGEQGKQRIACPQCGTSFVQKRKGQRYCSTECRSLAGYHRKRKREKEQTT